MINRLKNLYTVERELYYEVPSFRGKDYILYNSSGKKLATLTSKGILYVHTGFTFDGCTPKFKITLGGKTFIIGTSDGCLGQDGYPLLFHASLKHDVLCKIYSKNPSIYPRKTIDKEFQKDMKTVKWKWRGLYYSFVRLYAKIRGYK